MAGSHVATHRWLFAVSTEEKTPSSIYTN